MVKEGKSYGAILVDVKGWVSQEVDPESGHFSVRTWITPGERKQDRAEEEDELQCSHKKDFH